MSKLASILSVGGLQRAVFTKPLALLLALMILPPEMPVLGCFSLASKAHAQGISVCGHQATILQPGALGSPTSGCEQRATAFESEAVTEFEAEYNLKPGDGNLIYALGRGDLRMDFRAYMFNKLLAAIKNKSTSRTPAEQGMYNYFQSLVQQHQIALYTAAVKDRDLFLNDFCHWSPDFDIEGAYDAYMSILPYCGATVISPPPIFGGSPELPTKDYFLVKGYNEAYAKVLEKVSTNSVVPTLQLSAAQIAEMAAGAGGGAIGTGLFLIATRTGTLRNKIFPTAKARSVLQEKRVKNAVNKGVKTTGKTLKDFSKQPETTIFEDLAEAGATASRIAGPVSAVLLVATIVIGAVLAAEAAQERQDTINGLNSDLTNAKNTPPDLDSFISTDEGMAKATSIFLEMTLPDYPSSAPLPIPGANDPRFVTNSPSVTNLAGPITFKDIQSTTWTAQPYGQNWFVQTGTDINNNPFTKFSNSITYMGLDSSNNQVPYKAWSNNGRFTIAKTSPSDSGNICDPGPNGLFQGDTTNCVGFASDHLAILDVNNNIMNITLSQGVALDSPVPAAIAFPAGAAGHVTIQAHGIPAPSFTLQGSLPFGMNFSNYHQGLGVSTIDLFSDQFQGPSSTTFNLIISNTASTITVPFKLDVDSAIHITSSTDFTVTYGVPVNFTITATGSPVHFNNPALAFPPGLTLTDIGNGTLSIKGTPMLDGTSPIGSCIDISRPDHQCGITASNSLYSDFSPLHVTVLTPPFSVTSPDHVLFRDGEPNTFVVSMNGGVTPAGVNVYQLVDVCGVPSWLTKTLRPDGNLVLSGTPPIQNDVLTTYNLGFAIHMVGSGLTTPCPYGSGFVFEPSTKLALSVEMFPIFPPTRYLVVTPGVPIGSEVLGVGEQPKNVFTMGNPFNVFTVDGALPPGVNFNQVFAGFSFDGTVPVGTHPGDYKLTINDLAIVNNNARSEMFDLVVAQPPQDGGFKTFNLVVNQPGHILINPSGFPKNAVDTLPAMTAALNMVLPIGMTTLPGPDDGSIEIVGTPTQISATSGIFHASNGALPDLSEIITIRVIKPGDINADGVVDCKDVTMVKSALNSKLGFAGYSNLADVNGDGIVNIQDQVLVAKYLAPGTQCQ